MKHRKVQHSHETGASTHSPRSSHGSHRSQAGHHSQAKPASRGGHRARGRWLPLPALTPARIRFVCATAVVGDLVQLGLEPFGLPWAGQIVSALVAVGVVPTLGLHLLLLPTLILEFIPMADVLPTWSACVALILALRKGEPQRKVR